MGAENSKAHKSSSAPPSRRPLPAASPPLGARQPPAARAPGAPATLPAPPTPTLAAEEATRGGRVPVTGSGGAAGPSRIATAPLPLSASVPRYVDQHTMVFSSSFGGADGGAGLAAGTRPRRVAGAALEPAGAGCSSPHKSGSQPCQAAAGGGGGAISGGVGSSDFSIGAPASPLSPIRRPVPSLSNAAVSTPIAVPTYNSGGDDAGLCGSPILKSYRHHSHSTSVGAQNSSTSPTSPRRVFSGSNPGVFSFGGAQGIVNGTVGSPPAAATGSSHGPASGGAGRHEDPSGVVPIHQRYLEIKGYPLGLENYSNTCYFNSVIQLLYHCPPLRLRLLELHDLYLSKKGGVGFEENTLLYHLSSLMAVMHKSNNRQKDARKRELISPSFLLRVVKERNPAFNNNMQQDAHEFAMFILNDIMETESKMMTDAKNRALFMEETKKKKKSGVAFWSGGRKSGGTGGSLSSSAPPGAPSSSDGRASKGGQSEKKGVGNDIQVPELSPIQSILQGQFGSLTACLECNTISARNEVFIDLSLETTQGSSLLTCLHHFGDPEYFYGANKVRCDKCQGPARAAKTIHIQRLPEYAMIVHLKRFRYDMTKQTFTKKADHVALPMTMDVEEYSTDPAELNSDTAAAASASEAVKGPSESYYEANRDVFRPADEATKRKLRGVAKHKARFTLTGFVAHLGEGPSLGHYFTCVRYGPGLWRRFDDDVVSVMTEREVEQYFGVPINLSGVVTTTAYILLYERVA